MEMFENLCNKDPLFLQVLGAELAILVEVDPVLDADMIYFNMWQRR